MKHLKAINKYFLKYRWRLLLGIVFITLSNYFRILSPQLSGYVIDKVEQSVRSSAEKGVVPTAHREVNYDILVQKMIAWLNSSNSSFGGQIIICGVTLLVLALLG